MSFFLNAYLHVGAYVLTSQSYSVETYIVDLALCQAMVFEILYEGGVRGLECQAVAVHEPLLVGGQFRHPVIVCLLEFLMVGYLAGSGSQPEGFRSQVQ